MLRLLLPPKPFDVVVGSDITYDISCISDLVGILRRALMPQGGGHAGAVAYVAAMPRNQDTLDAFLAQAETSGLVISEVATKSKTRWMRASPDLSKVKLFRLTNEV